MQKYTDVQSHKKYILPCATANIDYTTKKLGKRWLLWEDQPSVERKRSWLPSGKPLSVSQQKKQLEKNL